MNKVILMGRLTRDPELRYSQGAQGTAVCRYSLAVNRSFKREGEPEVYPHTGSAISLSTANQKVSSVPSLNV